MEQFDESIVVVNVLLECEEDDGNTLNKMK